MLRNQESAEVEFLRYKEGDKKVSATLGFYPIFMAAAAVIFILAISILNMHLLAQHKTNHYTVCVYAASLFAVLSLVFHMISEAVIVLPLHTFYCKLSQITLLLTGFSMTGGIITALALGQKHSWRNLYYNIQDALSRIEDVVFVIDPDGIITYINHPSEYCALFGDIDKMQPLLFYIKEHLGVNVESLDTLHDSSDMLTYELDFDRSNAYIFRISPIIIGNTQCGYTAVLENISTIRVSEKVLQEQIERFEQANRKLSNYIKAAGALEAEKERLQILQQVQETLIRDIEKALFCIQDIKQHRFKDDTYQTEMKKLAAQLREIYQKVRSAVGQIAGKEGSI